MSNITYKTGDLVLADFKGIGHQQQGTRPAIIVSNNLGNKFSPMLEVIPLTTQKQNNTMPTHVKFVAGEISGLVKDSVLLAECKTSINKFQVIKILGAASEEQLNKVAIAMVMATPITIRAYLSGVANSDTFKSVSSC